MAFHFPNDLRCLRSRLLRYKVSTCVKKHCSIKGYLLYLVSFNDSRFRMPFGVIHRYILAINGAPCMFNVLCFTFHNSNIFKDNQ